VVSCVPDKHPGKPLLVQNNSSEIIYYWYSRNLAVNHFPDISLPATRPNSLSGLDPGNRELATDKDPDWEYIYNNVPADKFTVYFFATNPQTQQEWDELIESNAMLGHKSVTFDELKNSGYIISYP
jgi:hypothetical protein